MVRRRVLEIGTSPHIASGASVDTIMRHVVYALLPASAFAVYVFGLAALVTLAIATLSCVASEHLLCRASGRKGTVGDWSVVVTGLLYGLTLPPGLPAWMVVLGGVVAVGVGKFLFGGLGANAFNPALVGRAFLQAAFPVSMTSWEPIMGAARFTTLPSSILAFPFATPSYDAVTGATPLAAMKFDGEAAAATDLVLGLTTGSTGETAGLLLLTGGVYLAWRRFLNWRIPLAVLGSVFLLSAIAHAADPIRYPEPVFMLFAGGLMLGALFMATDMVASPMTSLGCVIYGILIGVLVVVIRFYGGMPEGVMYAILFANAASPHIDTFVRPRVYGTRKVPTP